MLEPLGPISPFFIVRSLADALAFYEGVLDFEVRVRAPAEDPFFAIVGRDSAQLFLKEIAPEIAPTPNHTLHEWAPWDAFVFTPRAEEVADQIRARGGAFHSPLTTREDGLRGFEVIDPDGHVLFFGTPIESASGQS